MCLGCTLGVEGLNHAVSNGNYGETGDYTLSPRNNRGMGNSYGSDSELY